MTNEQQQQYDSLPYSGREEYDWVKSRHPSWSHQQIMTKVAISISIEDPDEGILGKRGQTDINPKEPKIMEAILKGARNFLTGAGIFISEVFSAIDDALDTLGDLIVSGASYVGNKLKDFWDWLTN